MARTTKRTSAKSGFELNSTIGWIGGAAILGAASVLAWMMLRPKVAYAPELDYMPDDPVTDRFGNSGDDNMVTPLSLKEDEILMRDKMNPRNGLI